MHSTMQSHGYSLLGQHASSRNMQIMLSRTKATRSKYFVFLESVKNHNKTMLNGNK